MTNKTTEIRGKVNDMRKIMHDLNQLFAEKIAEEDINPACSVEVFTALQEIDEKLTIIESEA